MILLCQVLDTSVSRRDTVVSRRDTLPKGSADLLIYRFKRKHMASEIQKMRFQMIETAYSFCYVAG